MYTSVSNFRDYKTLPISLTGRWFVYGTNSSLLKRTDIDIDQNSIFNSCGRRIYALVGLWTAAPCGVLYHTYAGIRDRFFITAPLSFGNLPPLKEAFEKELKERAWQHFTAAAIDLKAFIQGVFLTAIGVSIAAAAVFFIKLPTPWMQIIKSTVYLTALLPLFDYIASPDHELEYLSQYLPAPVSNQIIGLYHLKELPLPLPLITNDGITELENINELKAINELHEKINKLENKSSKTDEEIIREKKEFDEKIEKLKEQLKEIEEEKRLNEKKELIEQLEKLNRKKEYEEQLEKFNEKERLNEKEKLPKLITDTNEFIVQEAGKLSQLSKFIFRSLRPKPKNIGLKAEEEKMNALLPALENYIESLDQLTEIFGSVGTYLSFQVVKHHCDILKKLQLSYQLLSLKNPMNENRNEMNEKGKEKEKKEDEGTSKIATKIIAQESDIKIEEKLEVIEKLDKLINWVADQMRIIKPDPADKTDPVNGMLAEKKYPEKALIEEEIQHLRNCDQSQ